MQVSLSTYDLLLPLGIKGLTQVNESRNETKGLLNPLSANFTKWSDKLKQFICKLSTNCLSVFGYFVGLVLKGLNFVIIQCSKCKPSEFPQIKL